MTRAILANILAFSLAVGSAQAAPAKAAHAPPSGPSPWQADFSDPILTGFLRQADLQSLDVRMALARLARAKADVDLARAAKAPRLDIGGEAAIGGETFSASRGGAGAPAMGSYEVDLFGRLARASEAAVADQAAAAQDVAAARLLVGAEVTRAYLDLRAAQARRERMAHRGELAERSRTLIALRRAEGRATEIETASTDNAAAEEAARLQAAQHAVERQLIRLGQLTGQADAAPEPAWTGTPWPSAPQIGSLPSEVVLRRPDVLAAASRLAAADARRAEAVAATRPRFTLTAALGSGDPNLLYLLDVRALAWAVAGSLTHSLFDGGAGKARVRAADAETELADLAYRKSVAQAWGEARIDLGQLSDAVAAEQRASAAYEVARRSAGAGELRRQAGLADGLAIVALQQQVESSAEQLASARAARSQAYVDLVLACGGEAS